MKHLSIIMMLSFMFFDSRVLFSIDAPEIVNKVKETYESTKNFSADFKQQFKWKLAGETQENVGKILLKDNDKFRIETEDQVIVSDGATLWTFSKMNNQVIIDNLSNADEVVLPREIFLRFSKKYKPLLLGKETLNNTECYVIQLIAESEDVFIKEMKLWIDKTNWLTQKIEQVDINKNITIYSLTNINTDLQIEDKAFDYKIPPNVEIIDMR